MLAITQLSTQHLSFNGVLADNIVKKNPKRIMKRLNFTPEQKCYEIKRGAKMGNLIESGLVTLQEAEKYLAEQYFAGRTDYIEGVNKVLSKDVLEKLYLVR